MTALVVRSPLQTLSMSSTQRATTTTRRRSARHAFDAEEQHDAAPIAKRSRTEPETNGTGGGKQAGGGKVNAAYDEEDDGFTFSRKTRSRKAVKPAAKPAPAEVSASAPAPPPAPAPAKNSKKKTLAAIAPAVADEIAPKRRRSARLSGDHMNQTQQPAQFSTPVADKSQSRAKRQSAKKNDQTPHGDDSLALIGEQAHSDQPSREGTKIALPFADTPIIKRNKEMRKGGASGHRRSSTGLRGRRASSLIDSGTSNAMPHAEVTPEDFYKHIEDSLPEPRRMKQLLTWCGTRALPEKPSGEIKDASAVMAARAIQQELLNDFASKSELSDWFNREDAAPTELVRKPNPRNVEMAAKLEELEREVKRLEDEKKTWEALLKTPKASTSKAAAANKSLQPSPADTAPDIDASVLDPEQAAILASLTGLSLSTAPNDTTTKDTDTASADTANQQPPTTTTPASASSTEAIHARLAALATSLEPSIDLFADGVHTLTQYRGAAERAADAALALAAGRLEERDRAARERAGTLAMGGGDVLRALAGVL
ncbi:uncharacterized protein K452DRAFT_205115, partial [Aplosporella prunicola CBS 121167]